VFYRPMLLLNLSKTCVLHKRLVHYTSVLSINQIKIPFMGSVNLHPFNNLCMAAQIFFTYYFLVTYWSETKKNIVTPNKAFFNWFIYWALFVCFGQNVVTHVLFRNSIPVQWLFLKKLRLHLLCFCTKKK
jgi:hypothetical protein